MGVALQKIAEREIAVADYLPFSYHVTDEVISTKNGEFLSVWQLDGRSHQAAALAEHKDWSEHLALTLRGLQSANIGIVATIDRRKVFEYPVSKFPNDFAAHMDAKYREGVASLNQMVNDLYLTIVYRPTTDPLLNVFAAGEKLSVQDRAARRDEAIANLEEINLKLKTALKRYRPELLGVERRRDGVVVASDDDAPGAFVFSTALEFLGKLVNLESRPVPICEGRIAEFLPRNRLFFATHGEIGEVRTDEGSRVFGMLDIAEYPSWTEAGQLNELLHAPYEFILTHSFTCLEQTGALAFMERHQKRLLNSKDAGRRQINDISKAREELTAKEIVLGHHHGSLLVFGKDAREVRTNLAEAASVMTSHGVITKRCDVSLEGAFWAQLPGNWKDRPRPAAITSRNFFQFAPFHNFMSGKPNGNPWGPAVTLLNTTSKTPFYFSWHSSAVDENATDKRRLGNTLFLGSSGVGKTVTMSWFVQQSLKFDPGMVCFDLDRGMEIFIRANGGRYLPLKNGEPSGFNPLQLDLTPANLMFLKQFIKLLVSVGGDPVTHKDETQIENALKALQLLDKEDRRFEVLMGSLPNPRDAASDHPSVAARLKKWTASGELGWLFDNPTDALDLSTHRLYGFDVTDFLDNPVIRPAVMSYLIHRTDEMIDGRPFIYLFDEFWKVLQDPLFEAVIQDKSKTIRKENGVMVFSTQEPSDALNSRIGKTVIAQLATLVLLPNKGADRADYMDGLKLTSTEFEIVRGLGEHSRQFLVKQGDASTVAKLDLPGFDDEMNVLSGTPDNAELVRTIIHELEADLGPKAAEDPANWLPRFYARLRAERTR